MSEPMSGSLFLFYPDGKIKVAKTKKNLLAQVLSYV